MRLEPGREEAARRKKALFRQLPVPVVKPCLLHPRQVDLVELTPRGDDEQRQVDRVDAFSKNLVLPSRPASNPV